MADLVQDAVIDDVRLVTEASCGTSDSLLDGGFELATNSAIPPVWRLGTSGSGLGDVEVIDAPAEARSGNGVLHLTAGQICRSAFASNEVVVAPAEPGGGPALRFWYRTSAVAESSGLLVTTTDTTMLPEALAWTRATSASARTRRAARRSCGSP